MAGLTISAVRDALKTQLVAELDSALQTNISTHGEARTPPLITIEYGEGDCIDYWGTFSSTGLAAVRFNLVIDPGGTDRASAVMRLDKYLSVGTGNGSSVVDAVMADTTLGGAVATCHIAAARVDNVAVIATLELEITLNKVDAEVG